MEEKNEIAICQHSSFLRFLSCQINGEDDLHLSEREILDFRLSSAFSDLLSELNQSTNSSDLESYLKFLTLCCPDYDFSFQFGDFGGHLLLKKLLKNSPQHSELCYELISIITRSGCLYPMPKNILHTEHVIMPLIYQFHPQQQELHSQFSFTVILRQIPDSMHGEGQIAVGYIIWSAALILSRWISFHSNFFDQKLVLEIGAGTGLCGLVACACGSYVVISDYTDIILRNIAQNIRLNRKGNLVKGTEGCLAEDDRVAVYHLDWNTLSSGNGNGTRDGEEKETREMDLKEKNKITSSFPSLSPTTPTSLHLKHHQDPDDREKMGSSYDIIIASDMVCCDSDALGVTNTLLSFLSPHGIALFATPHPYHRYGIAHLIPTLKERFHVFIRSVSHSAFSGQRHPSYRSDVLTEDLKLKLDHKRLHLIESLLRNSREEEQGERQEEQQQERIVLDDMLTEGLPEIEYFEWFLLIVIKKD